MEEEEEDYMSDAFLQQCANQQKDVRPGPIHSQAEKRRHDLLKKREVDNEEYRKKNRSKRVLEEEAREEGLNKEIGSDNKGFQLLQKMGYQPGTSLGNKGREGGGLKEPIPLNVKMNRQGLGMEPPAKKKGKSTPTSSSSSQAQKEIDVSEFRLRAGITAFMKQMERDLRAAQGACQRLDTQKELESPQEVWYWPEKEKVKKLEEDEVEFYDQEEDEEEDDDKPEVTVMLQTITEYLRDKYNYCIWCGTAYDDKDDLEGSCPGNSRDEH